MSETYTREVTIHGLSFFAGNVDNKDIDSGTIFVLKPLDGSNGRENGFRTIDEKCHNSDVVKPFLTQSFPFKAKVHYQDRLTKNKETKVIVKIEASKV